MQRLVRSIGTMFLLVPLCACAPVVGDSEPPFPNAATVSTETRVHVEEVMRAINDFEAERLRLSQETARQNWRAAKMGGGWSGTRWDPTFSLPVGQLSDAVDEWREWENNVQWPDESTDGVPSSLSIRMFDDSLDAAMFAEEHVYALVSDFECDPRQNDGGSGDPQWANIEDCWDWALSGEQWSEDWTEPLDETLLAADKVLAETA